MAMSVYYNGMAANALTSLNKNSRQVAKSLQKVSSGLKVTGASDGAAEYAISEKMRVQIRSLGQANTNAENGISLLKVAGGAMDSTVDILRTLKEKAIDAANDSNTNGDRAIMQKEFDQAIDQIDDNANVTFNGQSLLDGSKRSKGIATISILMNYALDPNTNYMDRLTSLKDKDGKPLGIQATDNAVITYTLAGETYSETLNGLGNYVLMTCGVFENTVSDDGQIHSGLVNFTNTSNGQLSTLVATDRNGQAIGTAGGADAVVLVARHSGTYQQIAGYTINIVDATGKARTDANKVMNSFDEAVSAEDSSGDNSIALQVGTKSNQIIKVSFEDMTAVGLGLKGGETKLQITTRKKANAAINVVDRALQKALGQQTDIGALQSSLSYTVKNLTVSGENVTAAESTLRDANMATEMTAYTKHTILYQATESILAQANQNADTVLKLLQ
jgi:flagellin